MTSHAMAMAMAKLNAHRSNVTCAFTHAADGASNKERCANTSRIDTTDAHI